MFKRQVFKCLVFFLFSAIGMILVLDTSLGQVRFEDPINLSDNPGDSWNPDIAAVDDQVLVFWVDSVPGKSDLRLAHSVDEGMTFRTWNLSPGIQYPYHAKVVADGDNIYVGFPGIVDSSDPTNTGIFLSRSNDRGESFYPPFDLSGRGSFNTPIMRIQDGILNVTWGEYDRESGFRDIVFSKSTDFGETFSEPVKASSNPQQWAIGLPPKLALDGNQVYVAWMGGRPGWNWHDIYFARSTDGGESFCETINLSQRTREEERTNNPQLAVGGKGYVYVAWSQGPDASPAPIPSDIYFVRSTDGGETFSERLNLSNNPRASNQGPGMVAAGDNIYIAWTAFSGGSNIFFSRSTDGGETFSEPKNISRSPGGSAGPQIAVIEKGKLLEEGVTDDAIYLVWQDGRTGNSSVFFSISLDGGATFSEPENISNSGRYAGGPQIAAVGRNVYVTYMGGALGSFNAFFIRGELELGSKSH